MRKRRGFTLLELILALGLTVIVVGLVSMAVGTQLRLAAAGRAQVQEAQLARALLHRIADDLHNAVPYSANAVAGHGSVRQQQPTAIGRLPPGPRQPVGRGGRPAGPVGRRPRDGRSDRVLLPGRAGRRRPPTRKMRRRRLRRLAGEAGAAAASCRRPGPLRGQPCPWPPGPSSKEAATRPSSDRPRSSRKSPTSSSPTTTAPTTKTTSGTANRSRACRMR